MYPTLSLRPWDIFYGCYMDFIPRYIGRIMRITIWGTMAILNLIYTIFAMIGTLIGKMIIVVVVMTLMLVLTWFLWMFWGPVISFIMDFLWPILDLVILILFKAAWLIMLVFNVIVGIWNALVPLIGMLLYIIMDLLITALKEIFKILGNAQVYAMFQAVLEILQLLIGILLEVLQVVLGVAMSVIQVLMMVIGPILMVIMSVVKVLFFIISWLFRIVFFVLNPILWLLVAIVNMFKGFLAAGFAARVLLNIPMSEYHIHSVSEIEPNPQKWGSLYTSHNGHDTKNVKLSPKDAPRDGGGGGGGGGGGDSFNDGGGGNAAGEAVDETTYTIYKGMDLGVRQYFKSEELDDSRHQLRQVSQYIQSVPAHSYEYYWTTKRPFLYGNPAYESSFNRFSGPTYTRNLLERIDEHSSDDSGGTADGTNQEKPRITRKLLGEWDRQWEMDIEKTRDYTGFSLYDSIYADPFGVLSNDFPIDEESEDERVDIDEQMDTDEQVDESITSHDPRHLLSLDELYQSELPPIRSVIDTDSRKESLILGLEEDEKYWKDYDHNPEQALENHISPMDLNKPANSGDRDSGDDGKHNNVNIKNESNTTPGRKSANRINTKNHRKFKYLNRNKTERIPHAFVDELGHKIRCESEYCGGKGKPINHPVLNMRERYRQFLMNQKTPETKPHEQKKKFLVGSAYVQAGRVASQRLFDHHLSDGALYARFEHFLNYSGLSNAGEWVPEFEKKYPTSWDYLHDTVGDLSETPFFQAISKLGPDNTDGARWSNWMKGKRIHTQAPISGDGKKHKTTNRKLLQLEIDGGKLINEQDDFEITLAFPHPRTVRISEYIQEWCLNQGDGSCRPGQRQILAIPLFKLLADSDCLNSRPRNILCLPQIPEFLIEWFRQTRHLPKLPANSSDANFCSGLFWIPPRDFTDWRAYFGPGWALNFLLSIRLFISIFPLFTLGIGIFVKEFPWAGPILNLLLPIPPGEWPTARDVLCWFQYIYALIFVSYIAIMMIIFAVPIIKWMWDVYSGFSAMCTAIEMGDMARTAKLEQTEAIFYNMAYDSDFNPGLRWYNDRTYFNRGPDGRPKTYEEPEYIDQSLAFGKYIPKQHGVPLSIPPHAQTVYERDALANPLVKNDDGTMSYKWTQVFTDRFGANPPMQTQSRIGKKLQEKMASISTSHEEQKHAQEIEHTYSVTKGALQNSEYYKNKVREALEDGRKFFGKPTMIFRSIEELNHFEARMGHMLQTHHYTITYQRSIRHQIAKKRRHLQKYSQAPYHTESSLFFNRGEPIHQIPEHSPSETTTSTNRRHATEDPRGDEKDLGSKPKYPEHFTYYAHTPVQSPIILDNNPWVTVNQCLSIPHDRAHTIELLNKDPGLQQLLSDAKRHQNNILNFKRLYSMSSLDRIHLSQLLQSREPGVGIQLKWFKCAQGFWYVTNSEPSAWNRDSRHKKRTSTTEPVRIMVVCGTHAREPITSEICFDWIQYLTTQNFTQLAPDSGNNVQPDSQRYEWIIVPIQNMNGRDRFNNYYQIDGTKKGSYDNGSCIRGNGNDVDLNRNWPHIFTSSSSARKYTGALSLLKENERIYDIPTTAISDIDSRPTPEDINSGDVNPGPNSLSETETKYTLDLLRKFRPGILLSMHSGAFSITYGYDSTPKRPSNWKQQTYFAQWMRSMSQCKQCRIGSSVYLMYVAEGTMTDYACYSGISRLCHTIEVYGLDNTFDLQDIQETPQEFTARISNSPTRKLLRADCLRFFNPITAAGFLTVINHWRNIASGLYTISDQEYKQLKIWTLHKK